MLGKIYQPDSPKWDDDHSRTNAPKKSPSSNFQQIEQKRQFPLSKDEQQKAVEQKPRSIYDLPKQEKSKKSSSETTAKGKTADKPAIGQKQVRSDARQPISDKKEEAEIQEREEGELAEMEEKPGLEEKPRTKETSSKGKGQIKEKPTLQDEQSRISQVAESEPEAFVEETEDFAAAEEAEMEEAPAEGEAEAPVQAKSQQMADAAIARGPNMGEVYREKPVSGESDEEITTTKKEKEKEGESKTSSRTEKGSEGSAFTAIQGIGANTEKTTAPKEAARSHTIRDLTAQIIDKIQVMRKENQTSTIITLRNPPILAGATITLTAADSAKREFNISFANLSNQAKVFLDQKLKEDPLTDALERKGITVHTLTTTTEKEKIIPTEAQPSREGQQDQQGDQQKKRSPYQPPEEDEE